MYLTVKEFEAISSAIDFISANSDGADEDKYPYDILNGLHSVCKKYRKESHKRLVKQALSKLKSK